MLPGRFSEKWTEGVSFRPEELDHCIEVLPPAGFFVSISTNSFTTEKSLRVGQDHDQRDARAGAEEIQRLHVAGVIKTAAFVRRDEDRGGGKSGLAVKREGEYRFSLCINQKS
jgi:hypothetical protein